MYASAFTLNSGHFLWFPRTFQNSPPSPRKPLSKGTEACWCPYPDVQWPALVTGEGGLYRQGPQLPATSSLHPHWDNSRGKPQSVVRWKEYDFLPSEEPGFKSQLHFLLTAPTGKVWACLNLGFLTCKMKVSAYLYKNAGRIDWFDLPAVQRAFKSLHQHQISKAPILQHSAFFMV